VYYFSSTLISDVVYSYTQRTIISGLVALGIVIAVSVLLHKRFHITKKFFYATLVAVIVATTGLLLILQSLLFTNQVGKRGLSARSADIRLFMCGQYVPVVQSVRNKKSNTWVTGNVLTFQGVMTDSKDISLGSMIAGIGGSITNYSLILPLDSQQAASVAASSRLSGFVKSYSGDNAVLQVKTGDTCDLDGSEFQVFVYRRSTPGGKATQYKLANPPMYTLSDYTGADSRDCIVIDFGNPKPYTEETCSASDKGFDPGDIL
jgi:hypothetical protein